MGEKCSAIIVDDDQAFAEFLREIFEESGMWNVTGIFHDLTDFFSTIPPDLVLAQQLLPDLLVLDVLSSRTVLTDIVPTTGLQIALILRNFNLTFGTLFISSMRSESLLPMVRAQHPQGWAYLTKSPSLTPKEILLAAEQALVT